ncbi:MAG: hypothetical protein HYT90_00160 [Candidatus Omnitrophica bacterium]|nr:hypothetical protein [Candidatus Omnitrophota bacterium]
MADGRVRAARVAGRILLALLAAGPGGCAPADRDQLAREVVAADPAFASVLDKHRELANRMETYRQELALKRKTVEDTIALLRKDLAAAAASVRSKTLEAKNRLQPERERLALSLSLAAEELRAKRAQRASLGRSIAQLGKSLGQQDVVLTPQERSRQQAQLDEMARDAARLDQELAAMREHVRLLKLKLLLIKL